MRIAVLDAPTNLGLRPPTPTSVPGCAKAPGALRDQGLVARLGARDAGCLTPPRYDPGGWQPGDGVAQAAEIARYSVRLADRIGAILQAGEFPLILGGDCSVAIGSMLAMKRLQHDRGGRFGLVYIDAHSDFRHPGNAAVVGAAAGEALALVTGRGQGDLASIEQRRPYVRDADVVLIGMRPTDDYRMDLQAGGFNVRTSHDVRIYGANPTAQWARSLLSECSGYWVHLDVDVLDPSVMPAVDAPTPGGIAYPELESLLQGLLTGKECLGMEVTVFDPDFDADGVYAQDLVNSLVAALTPLTAPPAKIPAQKRSSRSRSRRSTASSSSAASSKAASSSASSAAEATSADVTPAVATSAIAAASTAAVPAAAPEPVASAASDLPA
jgi:Arginase/agmatinase/formimionoglutamate hydrolase, arginase family